VAPNSQDLNPLDCHRWKKYHKLQPRPKTIIELKVTLQTIWEELPQEHKAVANFTKRWTVYMAMSANDGHPEHLQ